MYHFPSMRVSASSNVSAESGLFEIAFAAPDVFDMFSFGPFTTAEFAELNRPNTAVISRSMANRFFGDEDPSGRLLFTNGFGTGGVEVIGVMDDLPRNSHLRLDAFVSFSTIPDNRVGRGSDLGWGMYQFLTFVLLNDSKEDTLHGLLSKRSIPFPLRSRFV